MAKTKTVAGRRRPYEYDHHYGLALQGGSAARSNHGGGSEVGTSPRPARPRTVKKAAKKR